MFKEARLKLTAWYVLIIMVVCLLFSLGVYRLNTFEMERSLMMQALRANGGAGPGRMMPGMRRPFLGLPIPQALPAHPEGFDYETFGLARVRMAVQLGLINTIILLLSAAASYVLAGRTLKPIEEMHEEQKRFTSDASHELRTPLTAMKTEMEVALRDDKLGLEDAKEIINSSLEEVDRLKALSDSLLSLGRYESASGGVLEEFPISEAVEAAVRRTNAVARAKGTSIESGITEVIFKGDLEAVTTMMAILLDNAVKYSSKGGRVELRTETSQGRLELAVLDNGPGIDEKDLPHIFNRFYRSDTARTSGVQGAEGFGLGLAIAKRIAESHGGDISVSNLPEGGAGFFVSLPLKF